MSGADILKSPVRTYPDRMAVYFFDGDSCADIVSGTQEQQRAVFALVGQAQGMAALLLEMAEGGACESDVTCAMARSGQFEGMKECPLCRARAVLRDAGVLE